MQTLAKTVYISSQSSCKWSIFTESSTVSLHRTRPIRIKRLTLEITFSGLSLAVLAWACFHVNLHIPYFRLAKHKKAPFLTPKIGAIVKYSRNYVSIQNLSTKHLSMTMIIKSTTAKIVLMNEKEVSEVSLTARKNNSVYYLSQRLFTV